jgi:hypothetical protein
MQDIYTAQTKPVFVCGRPIVFNVTVVVVAQTTICIVKFDYNLSSIFKQTF